MEEIVYSVTPSQHPIMCSTEGHASTVDLLIMINTKKDAATINTLTMTILVGGGEDDPTALSTMNQLPQPTIGAGGDQWGVVVKGSTITISANAGQSNQLASALIFTLPGISVNNKPGNVAIDFTGYARNRGTPELIKVGSDYPVKKFYMESNGVELNPPFLYDQDRTVLLKWDCTPIDGKKYSYKLRSAQDDNWPPEDSYSCNDGEDGVDSFDLTEDTTFKLDVINPDGTIHDTLSLTVWIKKPVVTPYRVNDRDQYFGGRVIRLRWVADNTGYCEVNIDNQRVETNAPVDTRQDGFLVPVAGGARHFTPSVTAFAIFGEITNSEDFERLEVKALETIGTDGPMQNLAITPDGQRGLGNNGGNNITLIDVNRKSSRSVAVAPNTNAFDPHLSGMAVTSDGSIAVGPFVGMHYIWNLPPTYKRIALLMNADGTSQRTVELYATPHAELVTWPAFAAVTPDKQYALVTDSYNGHITGINLNSSTVESTISNIASPTYQIAVTPDGTLALVSLNGGLGLIDLSSPASAWGLEHNGIQTVFARCKGLAISADSRLALLVHGSDQGQVIVIDIPGRRALPPVAIGGESIAITTPHGSIPELAVVTSKDGSLTVMRVDDLQAKHVKIPLDPGYELGEIVISKTGGLNNHGVGLIATDKNHVIRFDVDELPWRPKSSGS